MASLTILDLGKVEFKRPNFHSKCNLFTIGFKSVRTYQSMVDPQRRCGYTCEILDGGDGPVFKVTCADDPKNPITESSSSSAWVAIQRAINSRRSKKRVDAISGPKQYGLAERAVVQLLASLPNADKCEKFRMPAFAGGPSENRKKLTGQLS